MPVCLWAEMISRRTSKEQTFFSESVPGATGFLATDGSFAFRNAVRKGRFKRINPKEYELLLQSCAELKQENASLLFEKDSLQSQILDVKTQYLSLQKEYEALEERFELVKNREEWGKMVRSKDIELQRSKEVIRKMHHDRDFAISRKTEAEAEILDLKCKLKKKEEEIKNIRFVEKVQSKAKVLGETERLRSELNEALANLQQQERLLENMKRDTRSVTKVNEERKLAVQELQKRLSNKDKQIEELKKQLVIARLFTKSK